MKMPGLQRSRPSKRNRPDKEKLRYTKQWQYYGGASSSTQKSAATRVQRNPEASGGGRRNGPSASDGLLRHARRAGYYVAAVIIVFSLVYCSILGNKVSVIMDDSSSLYAKPHYEKLLSDEFNKSPLNHSKLTFDARGFKQQSLANIPEADDMTVRIPLVGRKVVVALSFTQPALLMYASNHRYVVSTEGVVLAEASDIDESRIASLQVINEEVPVKVVIGKPILTKENVAFIDSVISELSYAHVPIESVTLPLGASELNVRVKEQPFIIKFAAGDSGGGAKQQVGAYLAVVHALDGQQQPSEYIDVRLAERVFVK